MDKDTTLTDAIRDEIYLTLDELVRRGAQRMLEVALQAEVDEYIRRHAQEQDEVGLVPWWYATVEPRSKRCNAALAN